MADFYTPSTNPEKVSYTILHYYSFRLKTPSGILIVGPSGCGETCFNEALLTHHLKELFVERPRVVYCYGAWQDKFKKMKREGINSISRGGAEHGTTKEMVSPRWTFGPR